ncbi:MAG TPA: PhnD/SsuA/transferrin family substrate-binding protein [Acidimicrobiia bacterium]|nr:PhnD/SsuA/transferrin family substrate-binding protein [Acidimicrobiia bacterium]
MSLLSANIDAALEAIASGLTSGGMPCDVVSGPWDARLEAVRTGRVDLLWMCGLLAHRMLDSGSLDARVVAAPVFEGGTDPTYRTVFVGRPGSPDLEDLMESRWAFNEESSWSGHHAARLEFSRRGLAQPQDVIWSGSHQQSLTWLREDKVDVSPIDETVWSWVDQTGLEAIDHTTPWPSPPLLLRSPTPHIVDALTTISAPFAGVSGLAPADREHLAPIARAISTKVEPEVSGRLHPGR